MHTPVHTLAKQPRQWRTARVGWDGVVPATQFWHVYICADGMCAHQRQTKMINMHGGKFEVAAHLTQLQLSATAFSFALSSPSYLLALNYGGTANCYSAVGSG
eukprot:2361856-Pleurochrysis_carterae.AAC.2